MVAGHPQHDWQVLLARDSGDVRLAGASQHQPRGPRRLANASAAVVGHPRLDRMLGGHLDVVWLPAPAPVAVSAGTPYVLTVHDLATELRPRDFRPYARLWSALARPRRLATRAAGVMVDASDTGDQMRARWGLPADRITLVQPGVWHPPAPSSGELAAVRKRYGLSGRYLLYVGALEPRKGLEALLEAFAAARAQGLEAGLVLVGDGELRQRLSGPGVLLCGRVADAELAALYRGARATVLPSLLEGFGFTPLESLAAGTPAVTSDLPSVRETLGDAGMYVPAGDAAALADALVRVDRDDDLRTRLVESGQRAVDALSWERAADQAMAALHRAAGQ